MNGGFGAYVIAPSWLVLDDELLAEPLRQPLRHDAGGYVGAAARGIAHDPPHWPGRVIERRGAAGLQAAKRGNAGGKERSKFQRSHVLSPLPVRIDRKARAAVAGSCPRNRDERYS